MNDEHVQRIKQEEARLRTIPLAPHELRERLLLPINAFRATREATLREIQTDIQVKLLDHVRRQCSAGTAQPLRYTWPSIEPPSQGVHIRDEVEQWLVAAGLELDRLQTTAITIRWAHELRRSPP